MEVAQAGEKPHMYATQNALEGCAADEALATSRQVT